MDDDFERLIIEKQEAFIALRILAIEYLDDEIDAERFAHRAAEVLAPCDGEIAERLNRK